MKCMKRRWFSTQTAFCRVTHNHDAVNPIRDFPVLFLCSQRCSSEDYYKEGRRSPQIWNSRNGVLHWVPFFSFYLSLSLVLAIFSLILSLLLSLILFSLVLALPLSLSIERASVYAKNEILRSTSNWSWCSKTTSFSGLSNNRNWPSTLDRSEESCLKPLPPRPTGSPGVIEPRSF